MSAGIKYSSICFRFHLLRTHTVTDLLMILFVFPECLVIRITQVKTINRRVTAFRAHKIDFIPCIGQYFPGMRNFGQVIARWLACAAFGIMTGDYK
ncbi:hypothetical protein D3C87_1667670 [compost metagenome]